MSCFKKQMLLLVEARGQEGGFVLFHFGFGGLFCFFVFVLLTCIFKHSWLIYLYLVYVLIYQNEQCLQIMNLGLRGKFMYNKHKISEFLP